MSLLRMFYVGGVFLGSKGIVYERLESEAESSFARSSLSFVSPETGEVWGRSPVLDGRRVMPYFVLTKPGIGEGHRSSYGPSGSMLSAGYWMINHLSPEMLRLELLIHCDWAMSRPTDLKEFLCHNSMPSSQPATVPTLSS